MYRDDLHAKGVKKTASVRNISPRSGLSTSTTPVAVDMFSTGWRLREGYNYIIMILCSANNLAFSYVSCPKWDSLSVVNEKNMGRDEGSADSTCTFLLRCCEEYAANNVAMSANERFSMLLFTSHAAEYESRKCHISLEPTQVSWGCEWSNPTTTVRKKNAEGIVNDDFTNGLRAEDIVTLEECLQHESSEISIFTEKIFLVKSRQPSQSSAPQCHERNTILGLSFGLQFVRNPSFAAKTHDFLVKHHTTDHPQ